MGAAKDLEEYTIEDIYTLPDGERAELIDGQLYMMAPPGTRHQRIVSQLHYRIVDYIHARNGSCEVFLAPFAVFLHKDERTYVEPDLSVICDREKLDGLGCKGAPDWVIEVVSPGSRAHDYLRKLKLYMNGGVREYWIVDPDRNRILVYGFEQDTMGEYSFGDSVKAGIFEGLEIDFSKMDIE